MLYHYITCYPTCECSYSTRYELIRKYLSLEPRLQLLHILKDWSRGTIMIAAKNNEIEGLNLSS